MSPYELIIDEIVTRLTGTAENPKSFAHINVDVQKLDEFDGAYEEITAEDNGRITIGLLTESFNTSQSNNSQVLLGSADQEGYVYFNVNIQSKRQYGNFGTFQYMYLVKGLLAGMKSNWSSKIELFTTQIQVKDKNTWSWNCIVRAAYTVIPFDNFLAPEDYAPGLTEVTFNPFLVSPIITTQQSNWIVADNGDVISTYNGGQDNAI